MPENLVRRSSKSANRIIQEPDVDLSQESRLFQFTCSRSTTRYSRARLNPNVHSDSAQRLEEAFMNLNIMIIFSTSVSVVASLSTAS